MPRKTKNLKGMRFGRLYVLEYDGTKKDSAGNTKSYWKCRCDCGVEKSIASIDLLQGKTKSCGCLRLQGAKPIINVVGEKFGKLTVLEMIKCEDKRGTYCKCLCDCGKEAIVNSWHLRHGRIKSCGCLKNQQSKRLEDLSGQRFGKLVAKEYVGKSNKKTLWLCQCDCGKEVIAYATNLKSGHATSCGCSKKPLNGFSTIYPRFYHIYKGMVNRCYNEYDCNYKNYGARGIKVCDEWLGETGLFNFVKWAKNNGYADNLTIDRIDNNKGYSPDNCRWADEYQQANNKRNNVILTYNGISKTLPEWSREMNLSASVLRQRKKLGWTDEQCLETKIGEKRKQ